MEISLQAAGLLLLREPFPEHLIGKLPKPTQAQTDEVKADFKKGIRCGICGGWHHPKVVHLDYVGHAALTDRLLDCDPEWNWEPVEWGADGPKIDTRGGMWIKLTVCGITRLGYGDAGGKKDLDPNSQKERIGDALRNAAMRFGAALNLWCKEDLHEKAATTISPSDVNQLKPEAKPHTSTLVEGHPEPGGKGLSPWTKKDVASIILGAKTVLELDLFCEKESMQIAIDLSEKENTEIQSLISGKRLNLSKKEAAEVRHV